MERENRKLNQSPNKEPLASIQMTNIKVALDTKQILKGITMTLKSGSLTALIGKNGAGKSTLLKAMLGELPYTGDIHYKALDGQSIKRPTIGYIPQKLLFDLSSPVSVLDVFAATKSNWPVWFSASKKLRENVQQNLANVGVDYVIDRQLGVLSGGELQRVLLALALDPMPTLLLLDEPVAGMDQSGLKLFYETVSTLCKQYQLAILLVSHDLTLVRHYADEVVCLNKGEILCTGKADMVFEKKEVCELFNETHPKQERLE